MNEILSQLPLFSLVLTIGAYQIGLFFQKKWKTPLCNPLLISVALVVGVLLLTGFSVETYQADMKIFSWLITPATVALAVPLYEQMQKLKKNLPAILAGVAAGAVTGLVSVLGLCALFSLDRQTTISLLPKSITTAIGMVISGQNGGIEALTSLVIAFTGIFGSVVGGGLCKLLKLNNPIAQGVAFGTSAHVIGTAKASEFGGLQGAVSSLSLAVAGVLTALLFPLVVSLI
jgi:predicted murein hydrolase (TIGR00659 family)